MQDHKQFKPLTCTNITNSNIIINNSISKNINLNIINNNIINKNQQYLLHKAINKIINNNLNRFLYKLKHNQLLFPIILHIIKSQNHQLSTTSKIHLHHHIWKNYHQELITTINKKFKKKIKKNNNNIYNQLP